MVAAAFYGVSLLVGLILQNGNLLLDREVDTEEQMIEWKRHNKKLEKSRKIFLCWSVRSVGNS